MFLDLGYRLDLGIVVGGCLEKTLVVESIRYGGCRHNKRDYFLYNKRPFCPLTTACINS